MKTETELKTKVFSAKRTETDRQEKFRNRNNTNLFYISPVKDTEALEKDTEALYLYCCC